MEHVRTWLARWSLHSLSIDREWWITLQTPFGYAQLVLGRLPEPEPPPEPEELTSWLRPVPVERSRTRGVA